MAHAPQSLIYAFIALQAFVVLFLLLHDWLPLPPLNDVKAAQAADSRIKLVATTLVSTIPYAIALWGCITHIGRDYPAWLEWLLWIGYGALLLGAFRAWWLPYLFVSEPARAARYKMFANTHAFLPEHNGVRPNTLHVIFHIVALATFVFAIWFALSVR